MRRRTNVLLAATALGLALGSWTVTPAGADDEQEAAPPRRLPASAFWTGAAALQASQLEGIEVAARAVEGGYELTLVNPSAADRVLRWQLECSHLVGSPMSRMGAIPVRVHEELVELRVPARGRATHVVRAAHPTAPPEAAIAFGSFASTQLVLRPAAQADGAPVFAVLSVPASADAPAGS